MTIANDKEIDKQCFMCKRIKKDGIVSLYNEKYCLPIYVCEDNKSCIEKVKEIYPIRNR